MNLDELKNNLRTVETSANESLQIYIKNIQIASELKWRIKELEALEQKQSSNKGHKHDFKTT